MEPSFYHVLFPYGLGVFLAWAVIRPTRALGPDAQSRYLTLFIAVVIAGFPGFALAAGDGAASLRELGAAVVLGTVLFASRWVSLLLPVAWVGHGAWDLLFLAGVVESPKPEWVCELCVPFDLIVGGWTALQLRARRGTDTLPG